MTCVKQPSRDAPPNALRGYDGRVMTPSSSSAAAAHTLLDDPAELADITRTLPARADGARRLEAVLTVDGVHCAACVVGIENALRDAVESVSVNAATRRAHLIFLPQTQPLSGLFARIERLGYHPRPVSRAALGLAEAAGRRRSLWRMLVALLCMMQVMMYAVPRYVAGPGDMSPDIERLLLWAEWVLTLPVMGFAAGPFFTNAWRDLRARRIGMDVPVALGIAVTFVASSAAALQGAAHGSDGIWFDSVTMFVAFLLIGRWLEAAARERALAGVGDLMARLPQTVERLDADGHSATVAPRALLPGDRVRLAVGQAVPADGTVLDGHSHADESMLTGESRPVVKHPGDALAAGSLNLHAPLTMVVRKAVQHSRLQEIVDLMDAASARKPRLAQLADRFAGPFLIAVLVLAGAAFVAWQFIDASRAVWVAASVLVVACPCALSLATPTALLAASGQLARNGLLARSPQAIEALARADTFVFDKTGTLTSDRMSVSRTVLTPRADAFGLDAARALSLAAALEGSSLHPVAAAIRLAAQTQTSSAWNSASDARLPVPSDPTGSPYLGSNPELVAATWKLTDLQERPGAGLSARVLLHDRWHDVRLGSAAFAGRLDESDATVVLALDGQPVAGFEISESLRPDALTLVQALQAAGVGTEILSGDTPARVQAVAERLGVTLARSAASPQDKLARIVALTQSGRHVAMVGDGINDAPVLAQAEVSVAFATGAALAQHHADLLILGEGLGGLAQARTLARRTLRVVAQNLAFAAAYNALCIPLALAGLLPPWLAGIGMAGSSLVVVLNALRLAPRASVTAQRAPSVSAPSPAMT